MPKFLLLESSLIPYAQGRAVRGLRSRPFSNPKQKVPQCNSQVAVQLDVIYQCAFVGLECGADRVGKGLIEGIGIVIQVEDRVWSPAACFQLIERNFLFECNLSSYDDHCVQWTSFCAQVIREQCCHEM